MTTTITRIIKTKLAGSIALLAFAALFVLPSTAAASYYADCWLDVSIQKLLKPADKKKTIHRVKVKLKVLKIGKQTGHSTTHCTSRKMQGKSFEVFLLTGQKKLTKLVRKGAKLRVKFNHSNGMTMTGAVFSDTWWLKPAKTKATKTKPTKRR